jgi:hypothetical protein
MESKIARVREKNITIRRQIPKFVFMANWRIPDSNHFPSPDRCQSSSVHSDSVPLNILQGFSKISAAQSPRSVMPTLVGDLEYWQGPREVFAHSAHRIQYRQEIRVPTIDQLRSPRLSPGSLGYPSHRSREYVEDQVMAQQESTSPDMEKLKRSTTPFSLEFDCSFEPSESDIHEQLNTHIELLDEMWMECSKIRSAIESELRLKSLNVSTKKEKLTHIFDMVTSKDPDEHVDGLLMLGVFMNENKESINWDGLMIVFREIMRFIPSLQKSEHRLQRSFQDTLLAWDAACFCIGRMCNCSRTILNLARSLHAVPRILSLLQYMRMNYFLNRIQL